MKGLGPEEIKQEAVPKWLHESSKNESILKLSIDNLYSFYTKA